MGLIVDGAGPLPIAAQAELPDHYYGRWGH